MTSNTCGMPISFNSCGMSPAPKSCAPKVATCGVYKNNAPPSAVPPGSQPHRISYLVPMSPSSSVSIAKAAENSNLNIIKDNLVHHKNVMVGSIKNLDFNIAEAAQNAALGGMSLWFLVLAVLICVILFSSRSL